MICSVTKPLHYKPQWGAEAGIEKSCLTALTNLGSFHWTSSSCGRDSLMKSVAGGTLAKPSQVGN